MYELLFILTLLLGIAGVLSRSIYEKLSEGGQEETNASDFEIIES
jgi:hypothetical protein